MVDRLLAAIEATTTRAIVYLERWADESPSAMRITLELRGPGQ